MNGTYSGHVERMIHFNPLPIALEAPDRHLKRMIVSERLGLGIYMLQLLIYHHPVLSDNLHLPLQVFKVLFHRLKILQRLFI